MRYCNYIDLFTQMFSEKNKKVSPWHELNHTTQSQILAPLNYLRKSRSWHEKKYLKWKEEMAEKLELDLEFGRYYFEQAMDLEERNRFLVLYSKLRNEGLWYYVDKISWVGGTIVMTFYPNISEARFKQKLRKYGYGDWWGAGRNARWGYRSRFRGAQLHFKGGDSYGDPIHVHIDEENPGDPLNGDVSHWFWEIPGAISHYNNDELNRDEYTAFSLFLSLCHQGDRIWFVTN